MKLKRSLIIPCCSLCGLFCSCSVDPFPVIPDNPEEIYHTLIIKDNQGNIHEPFMIDGENVYLVFPSDVDFSKLEFVSNETVPSLVSYDGILIEGGMVDFSDFTRPYCCEWRGENVNDSILKTIVVFDIPVLTIDTPDSSPITSKTERKEGCNVKLLDTNKNVQELGTAGIRGRGQSTWNQPKKPYNIKFDKKQGILGMNESKHWLLLANAYYDRTQIHNSTAFEIARLTDFPWVQSGEYVELFLNGDYQGLYYLCEKIGAEKGKIELSKNKEDTPVEDCSFLLESYVTENKTDLSEIEFPFGFFYTGVFSETGRMLLNRPSFLGWEIKEPDDNLTEKHVDYIRSELQNLENLIKNDAATGSYRDLFDIETAINWFFVEELCLNDEAELTKNLYMYITGGGKFTIGPPWDFDAWTFGMVPFEEQGYWDLKNALYYERLFEDPVFVTRLKEKWEIYKPIWKKEIPIYIDNQYAKVHRSAERNENMWPNWNQRNKYPEVSYKELIERMKDAFMTQLSIMDTEIHNL